MGVRGWFSFASLTPHPLTPDPNLMGMVGIEPTREVISRVFETRTSACSVTSPRRTDDRNVRVILAFQQQARQRKGLRAGAFLDLIQSVFDSRFLVTSLMFW